MRLYFQKNNWFVPRFRETVTRSIRNKYKYEALAEKNALGNRYQPIIYFIYNYDTQYYWLMST